MQRHIVDVVARVGIVGIVVVRFVHPARRLGVEERRQFLEQPGEKNHRYSVFYKTLVRTIIIIIITRYTCEKLPATEKEKNIRMET